MMTETRDRTVAGDPWRQRLAQLLAKIGSSMGLTSDAQAILIHGAVISAANAGQTLVSAVERDVRIHFLLRGAVRVTCDMPAHSVTVEYVSAGRFFGLGSFFDPPGPRCFGAMAHVPCVVASFTPDVVQRAFALLPPHGAVQLVAFSWRGFSRIVFRKARATALALDDRLLTELRVLARDFGVPSDEGTWIDMPLTVRDLSELVGATRGACSRALHRLRASGIVQHDRHRLELRGTFAAGSRQSYDEMVDNPVAAPTRSAFSTVEEPEQRIA
jgi:CRP-like cAMP-binding protein